MTTSVPIVALEISPLGERHYTGIANVTRMLAREMLADPEIDARFFMGRNEIPRSIIEKLVDLSGGDILWWLAGRFRSTPRGDYDASRPIIGIFPSTKQHRRLFPFEVLIVHDLTTIVTPHYHTSETVQFWQRHLLPDMLSSDLLVAVSQSTASDIRTYYQQVGHIPCIVVPEAACVREIHSVPAENVAPYILVLGTLEPRKNVEIVFEVLAERPELLNIASFVFVGRWGWGPKVSELMQHHKLDHYVAEGKIVFTGFVSDNIRDRLLASALAVIYPSFYEGFGLPVLEAMFYGTAVITTYSTSLPEVGGDMAVYFDPFSVSSLHQAIRLVTDALDNQEARVKRKSWARQFTWTTTYKTIRDAALAAAAAVYPDGTVP